MEKEKNKLLEKQQADIEHFEAHCARQIETIKHNQELKLVSLQARQSKLTSEIDMWKMNPPSALPPIASASPDLQQQSVMTPRTVQRLSQFKRTTKQPVITVKPLGRIKRPRTISSTI